ncbi:serine protease, S1-C subfamily, contains C-terminal PDZ domain [Peptoclostridium litorale DSM 5388]|uniref:Putative serine protease HtrA n=1 Tax=Peptoclostridium litorale DSM 5388 TaxID=1121324 RepID=A0A069RH23_PEPLI|nr:trypsin-like peptidase domain-containing protein [Peptoclostridium litorale]KDR96339.1 putative serine protease HtrA [Peptoclostridium litorale DSM 5388]SIO26628.1 serine protease, S1-C subfamily, contains C-terminal PDZ domain [Peptoclostridium litorale DSM 5388]
MSRFFTGLIGAVVGCLLTLYTVFYAMPDYFLGDIKGQAESGEIVVTEMPKDSTIYKAVAKKAMPSVVGITTVTVQEDFFYGARKTSGVGTGVIVDSRGYILTNAHVIGDGKAEDVNVLFDDGSNEKASVLWYDTVLDLAVIKVEKQGLIPAELGDSDNVEVGDIAMAIGNPLGLEFERSLTQGIISGLNRSIQIDQYQTIENLIQTDATINPGNSGGPLLNSKGQVIGINTAKIQTAEGLGFAIPINMATPIVNQFIEKGEFERVLLGIRGVEVSRFERATGTDLSVDDGLYVVEVSAGSAAASAGMQNGDIIVKIGNKDIKIMGDLIRELYKYSSGDSVKVKVIRDGQEKEIEVTF